MKRLGNIFILLLAVQVCGAQNTNDSTAKMSPEYPGGFVSFFKLIQNSISPSLLEEDSISPGCQVFHVKFTVDSTGATKDIHFLYRNKPVKKEAEFISALQKDVKKWKPAQINNKPVNTTYDLPARIRML